MKNIAFVLFVGVVCFLLGYGVSYLTADFTMSEAQASRYCSKNEVVSAPVKKYPVPPYSRKKLKRLEELKKLNTYE